MSYNQKSIDIKLEFTPSNVIVTVTPIIAEAIQEKLIFTVYPANQNFIAPDLWIEIGKKIDSHARENRYIWEKFGV